MGLDSDPSNGLLNFLLTRASSLVKQANIMVLGVDYLSWEIWSGSSSSDTHRSPMVKCSHLHCFKAHPYWLLLIWCIEATGATRRNGTALRCNRCLLQHSKTEQYLPHRPGKEITDEQQKSFTGRAAIGVCPWLIDRIFLAEPFPRKPMTFTGFVKLTARVRRKFKTHYLRPY